MKLENGIKNNLKDIYGSLSVFGKIYDSTLSFINKNKKIISCDLISEYSFIKSGNSTKNGKIKKFNIKKIRKIYKKMVLIQLLLILMNLINIRKL